MLLFRPIQKDDLPRLVALTRSIDGTLTTLPPNEELLSERIDEAQRAFRPGVKKPAGEFYLFVLEDTASQELIGTSGIAARVGGFEPFYSYEIRPEQFTHAPLTIQKEIPVLHLREVHRGPTEICSLFLRADHRRGGAGRLLSLGRFLFMAAFPERFDATVIAELRGYIDQQGRSPFWEAVGRHFFEHDFYTADRRCGIGNKQFIADLMPRHPIYVPLLPPEVQAAIGKVHHDAEAAWVMLGGEGFGATNEVDIFDAGPQLRAATTKIRTVRQSKRAVLESLETSPLAEPTHLVANGSLEFRACLGHVTEGASGVRVGAEVGEALQIRPGDEVWFAPLRPSR